MNHILEFLSRHGSSVLFAMVFIEQFGVPLLAARVVLGDRLDTVTTGELRNLRMVKSSLMW